MDQAREIERRGHDRIEVRWPITLFTDHGAIEAETRNVSVDGIFICCEEPLQLNEICPMSIEPPDHQTIDVSGKVIWSDFYAVDDRDNAFGTGICFVEISDGDRHFLEDVLSAHPQQ
jgi:hypothetical protein